ncbi:MAG TPA: hypothetical protein PKW07_10805 [Syntrophorhabdaceae bacterium]|nr:hypothetical protein [Syntrophorhabdaceae bacterium]
MIRLIFFFIFLFPCVAHSFWPLTWELDSERHFLGPLFSYKKDEVSTRLAIRPFLFSYESQDGGVYRYLYPLGKSDKDTSYFVPFYMKKKDDDKGNTAIFPFFWGESKKGNYFGIFPFYGRLYNRFNKDEMGFFMWPIYSYSEVNEARKTNILWPFFAFYSGKEEGIKAWPLFGFRNREGESYTRFFLWPIFFQGEKGINTDDPVRSFYAIPFYIHGESKKSEFKSILWPIYTRQKTEYKKQLDLFWPIYTRIEGEDREGMSVFPLYTYDRNEKDVKYSILWPVFRDSIWYRGEERYVYKWFLVINRYIEDEKGTFFNVWPFFEYRCKDKDYNFYFPSIFPLRYDGVDVIIKPLITLYERKKRGDKTVSNVLYGLYTKEEDSLSWKRRFAFIFELKKEPEGMGFELLSGVLAIDSKKIKLFFIPIERQKE